MSLQIQLKKSAVTQKQPFASDLAIGELALNYNADGPFLTCKDTAGNVRKLNNVWVGATAPTGPSAGDLWLDTSAATAVLKVYKDSSATWVNATTIPLASTSVYGTVQLATSADITNGTAGKVVDAAQLQSKITAELSASPITFQEVEVVNNVTIDGNLTVNGTTTTIDTVNLVVKDKNIEMGVVDTPTDTTADGGGITLKGTTDKTINWVDATDAWTSSERFSVPLGSAASPSLTFTGDENTGIYSPGADQVAISTNGTGRLFVDASGRVGVGVASPSQTFQVRSASGGTTARFENTNSGNFIDFFETTGGTRMGFIGHVTATNFYIHNDKNGPIVFDTNNTERMRLDSSGRLGLGTSTPDALLTVNGVGAHGLGSASAPSFTFTGDLNTGIYSPGADQVAISTNGTGRLFVDDSGNVGVGTAVPSAFGKFVSIVSGTNAVFTDNASSDLRISTGASVTSLINSANAPILFGTNNTERARITSDGKVGLGTSSPGAKLEVIGGSGSGDVAAHIKAGDGGATVGLIVDGDAESNDILIKARSNSSATPSDSDTKFIVTGLGNVGVGTTSPGAPLHVNTAAGTQSEILIETGSSATAARLSLRQAGAVQWNTGLTSVTGSYEIAVDGGGTAYTITRSGLAIGSHQFLTGGSERARIDSSGGLLVGTSSAFTTSLLQIQGTSSSATGPGSIRIARGIAAADFSTGNEVGSILFTDNAGGTFASITSTSDAGAALNDYPGRLVFSVTADGASSPTEALRISNNRAITVSDGGNVVLGTTTGTKIGTTTTQKLGFYNATPVVQPAAVADATDAATVITQLNDLLAKLRTLGIIAT